MPRAKPHETKLKKKYYPLVSICTPTFNRRPFIPTMFECFRNQTYPKDRIEWIIVDDGTDRIRDLVESSGITQIKYFEMPKKVSLGEKRNYMHSKATGTIIVYMDDDDYYPPERVSHAVEKLMDNKQALCAGSSEIYIYFKHIKKMIQFGPYGPNHATAGTFAFRAELLKQTRYQDHAAVAEEREFLKGYTIPFVQLDPMKTILCFSHEQNTFDKRKLLDNPHPDYVKESTKKITDFIRLEKEANIKKFFAEDIDPILEKYEPGNPKMKPDVLKQIAEIEKDREKMMQEEMAKNGQIMLNEPGKKPVPMSMTQVAELLSKQGEMLAKQGEQLQVYERRISELEVINRNLQKLLMEKSGPKEVKKPSTLQEMNTVYGPALPPTNLVYGPALPPKNKDTPVKPLSKTEPLFKLDPSMI
jgi:glycosyltransferase involved in cell wall biosynthesis